MNKKTMHILLYILGAGLGIYFICALVPALYGLIGVTAIAFHKPNQETNMVASFSCDSTQLRLIHHYSDTNENDPYEELYFEFDTNGTTTQTESIRTFYNGWDFPRLAFYHSANTLIKTFPGFTLAHSQDRAWNIFAKTDSVLFSELSNCLTLHDGEINSALQTFKPRISYKADKLPLTINSIANISSSDNYEDTKFHCEQEGSAFTPYKVTVVKEPDIYKPQISTFDWDNFSGEYDKNPLGFWIVTLPGLNRGVPVITDLRSCKNSKGETLGTYLDAFTTFASFLDSSDK